MPDGPDIRAAMILAAGRGERLRPLTDTVPKPLMRLGGRTLLARAAARLSAAGIRRLAVNAHHLPDDIAAAAAALTGFDEVRVLREDELLGTGGGLANARGFLRSEPHVLLHNGDVECDADPAELAARHLAGGGAATLLLVDWPPANTVLVGADGTVRDVGGRLGAAPRAGDRRLTYAGVGAFAARFLAALPEGASALADALIAAIASDPSGVRGWAPDGVRWSDLGTPGRYLDALLRVDDRRDVPEVAAAVRALPALRGTGWESAAADRLGRRGSDRAFWRLSRADGTAVLMKAPESDPETGRSAAVARFLHDEDLGGAAVLAADTADGVVLTEDLGDDTLLRLVHADPSARPVLYGQVLDALVALQVRGAAAIDRCPPAADRRFDADLVAWEHAYFRERFATGYGGLDPAELAGAAADQARVGARVLAQPVVLMHRDFQSQNILLKDGRVRLVDVQGARRGPYAYDLMSLLRDGYVDLDDGLRRDLLERYRVRLAAAGGPAPAPWEFRRDAVAAGLQRVMQALGAFAFLAMIRGKRNYLDHIPLGMKHLNELLQEWRALPEPPLEALEKMAARLMMK